ncbi:MAG: nucleoside triphosphate pyrophosphatase [Pseudomonadota bacterium]
MKIILASSSEYRKRLLAPLISSVICISPKIDESILPDETAKDYVSRLALEKAETIANDQNNALVIGSDQCAVLNKRIITKPNTPENAFQQLKASSGNTVTFYTGLSVINTKTNSKQISCEHYRVTFRKLSDKQIKAYLEKDQPYDCAGSFKAEGLGITLFEKLHGDDPNTLIGLPLIKLTTLLMKEGFDVLSA